MGGFGGKDEKDRGRELKDREEKKRNVIIRGVEKGVGGVKKSGG